MLTHIKALFGIHAQPTALSLAVSELEETEREKLRQASLAEYHTGMCGVLDMRSERLRKTIQTLSESQAKPAKTESQAKPDLRGPYVADCQLSAMPPSVAELFTHPPVEGALISTAMRHG